MEHRATPDVLANFTGKHEVQWDDCNTFFLVLATFTEVKLNAARRAARSTRLRKAKSVQIAFSDYSSRRETKIRALGDDFFVE